MYIHMYVRMLTYVHMYIKSIYIERESNIHMYLHTKHTHVRTYDIRTYIHTKLGRQVRTYVHTYVLYIQWDLVYPTASGPLNCVR